MLYVAEPAVTKMRIKQCPTAIYLQAIYLEVKMHGTILLYPMNNVKGMCCEWKGYHLAIACIFILVEENYDMHFLRHQYMFCLSFCCLCYIRRH